MRICIVSLNIASYYRSQSSRHGGAESQAGFIAESLAAAGQDVRLVVANLRPDDRLPYPAENAFDTNDGLPGLRFFHPRITGLYKALERADADLYYQRNASVMNSVTGTFCRRHGRVFVYGAGSDTDMSFRTVRLDGIRDRLLHTWGLKMADGIVAQNDRQASLCREHLAKPVRVISNGIDVGEGASARGGDDVVWVGAIRRVKQPELFLELARLFPERTFVMIGGAGSTERTFSAGVAESAKGIPNLRMAGHVSREAVLEHLSHAAVLVNTSLVEGFPNAYLEAWSLGVPVVAFGDIDGLIEREQVGAVCSDPDDMAERLGRLFTDSASLAAMGVRARALVEQRFSPSVLAREYVAFFQELVGGRVTEHSASGVQAR